MWQIPLRSLHNAIIAQIQAITSVAPYNECLWSIIAHHCKIVQIQDANHYGQHKGVIWFSVNKALVRNKKLSNFSCVYSQAMVL